MLKVKKVALPADARIALSLPRIDYADAYRCRLPAGRAYAIESLVQLVLATTPRWVSALMRTRDVLVRPFGLKTAASTAAQRSLRAGRGAAAYVGFFRVFQQTDDELVLGEDDRHLDFRVSVQCGGDAAQPDVTVSTVVMFNSWLGRLYFVPVRIGHRLIVPALMRHALRRL